MSLYRYVVFYINVVILVQVLTTNTVYSLHPNYSDLSNEDFTLYFKFYFDLPLLTKHDKMFYTRIKNISIDWIKNVEQYFRPPALNFTLNLKLYDAIGIWHAQSLLTTKVNGEKMLRDHCQWQIKKRKENSQHYYSILVTGLSMYYLDKKKKNADIIGYSLIGKACTNSACLVVTYDDTVDMITLLAHELAHSFGVYHDAEDNNCKNGRNIMRTHLTGGFTPPNPQSWSHCSRSALENYFRSNKSQCLKSGFVKPTFKPIYPNYKDN